MQYPQRPWIALLGGSSSALVLGALTARPVHAATDTDVAQQLFDGASALMTRGDYEHACPMFAKSEALDHGGGTLLSLAFCYEKLGRYATAAATYRTALDVARRDRRTDRSSFAEKRLAEVTPLIAHIRLLALATSSDVELVLDGRAVGRSLVDVSVLVDPGGHRVLARAPGRPPFEALVTLEPGASATVAIPAMGATNATTATIPVGTATLTSASTPASLDVPPLAPEAPRANPMHSLGVASLIAGGSVLTIGGFGFLVANSQDDKAARNEQCTASLLCATQAADAAQARSTASGWRTFSTGAAITGVAVLVTGLVLMFVSSSDGAKTKSTAQSPFTWTF